MSDQVTKVEETFVETSFGTVTSRRVIYNRAKGWLSGGSREDIPLQHVTSVRLDISRSIIWGMLLSLVGFGCLASGEAVVVIAGLLFGALGLLLIWGSPSVKVNTAGQDLNAAKGWPWQRGDANNFVETLRKQLFKS